MEMMLVAIGCMGLILVLTAVFGIPAIWIWRKIDARVFGTCYE